MLGVPPVLSFRKVMVLPDVITKPDSFPLPRMEDCVDRVGSATFVSKLDFTQGILAGALDSSCS